MAAAIAAKLGAIRPPQPGEAASPPVEEEKRLVYVQSNLCINFYLLQT